MNNSVSPCLFLIFWKDEFDNFVTICKFSKDEPNLVSIKKIVNFDYDKRQRSNDERRESTFFPSDPIPGIL